MNWNPTKAYRKVTESRNGSSVNPKIVEGDCPSPMSELEIEARDLRIRAQVSESTHLYETEQMFSYLKQVGANPKPEGLVSQMLAFCNALLKERRDAQDDVKLKFRQLAESRVMVNFLRADIDDLKNKIASARADTEKAQKKAQEINDKLDKAGNKRKEAVDKVMQQMEAAALSHARDKQMSEAHLRTQVTMLENRINMMLGSHRDDLNRLKSQHENDLKTRDSEHKAAQTKLEEEKEREIDEIVDSHDAETEILKERVRELATDLISQTDDYRPATDQGLRLKLQDLRNRIKNITVPSNLYRLSDAEGSSRLGGDGGGSAMNLLPFELDPSGFVARHESRDYQFILRSLVWKVLVEEFFSAPFGFGFLGPDEKQHPGRQQLLEIHRAWTRLYEGSQAYQPGNEFAMYTHDYNANKLRAAVFQSFLPVVFPEKVARQQQKKLPQEPQTHQQLDQTPSLPPLPSLPFGHPQNQDDPLWPGHFEAFRPGGGGPPGLPPPPYTAHASTHTVARRPRANMEPGIAVWHKDHCESVVANIRALLNRITASETNPAVLDAVPEIVRLAAELGLECGVQRAQLWLLLPKRGEVVPEGAEYESCLGGSGNADTSQQRSVVVDLLVSPGLVRVGDGRGDMAVRKALLACEVFPQT